MNVGGLLKGQIVYKIHHKRTDFHFIPKRIRWCRCPQRPPREQKRSGSDALRVLRLNRWALYVLQNMKIYLKTRHSLNVRNFANRASNIFFSILQLVFCFGTMTWPREKLPRLITWWMPLYVQANHVSHLMTKSSTALFTVRLVLFLFYI